MTGGEDEGHRHEEDPGLVHVPDQGVETGQGDHVPEVALGAVNMRTGGEDHHQPKGSNFFLYSTTASVRYCINNLLLLLRPSD